MPSLGIIVISKTNKQKKKAYGHAPTYVYTCAWLRGHVGGLTIHGVPSGKLLTLHHDVIQLTFLDRGRDHPANSVNPAVLSAPRVYARTRFLVSEDQVLSCCTRVLKLRDWVDCHWFASHLSALTSPSLSAECVVCIRHIVGCSEIVVIKGSSFRLALFRVQKEGRPLVSVAGV